MYRVLITLSLLSIVIAGCQTNPISGRRELMLVSRDKEAQMDAQYAPEIEKQLESKIEDPELQNYVQTVGKKVALSSHCPGRDFKFIAVNHKMVNAMALPGGTIYITRGMLETLESEGQLAAVLGHEIAHVCARHVSSAMSTQIGMGLLISAATSDTTPQSAVTVAKLSAQIVSLGFSRSDEREADSAGLDYLARSGYPAQAMAELMQVLEDQSRGGTIEFFSTHPNPENRKELIQNRISIKAYRIDQNPGKDQYRQNVLDRLK